MLSQAERAEELKQKIATADDSNEADFLKLSHDIAFLEADLEKVNNRKKNISLINDQVGGWTRRVGEKLTEQVEEALKPDEANEIFGSPKLSKKLPLSNIFGHITQMVTAQLDQIIQEKQRTGENTEALLVDLIPDFVNEEYKTKNQRVRPESHMSTGGNENNARSSDGEGNEANEEKFNEDTAYEMRMQREKIKK